MSASIQGNRYFELRSVPRRSDAIPHSWRSKCARSADMSRLGARLTVTCAIGYGRARAQLLKPEQFIHVTDTMRLFYGLKSNGLVASIWLKIVSPVEDGVACVTVNPVREYSMALELPPTSATGTVSVRVAGLEAV